MLEEQNLEVGEFAETAIEINSLDVNQKGEIALAAVVHPTKVRGGTVDRGLMDPRIIVFWNKTVNEKKIYKFDESLQIPRDQFLVSFIGSTHEILAKAGDQIFVLH